MPGRTIVAEEITQAIDTYIAQAGNPTSGGAGGGGGGSRAPHRNGDVSVCRVLDDVYRCYVEEVPEGSIDQSGVGIRGFLGFAMDFELLPGGWVALTAVTV